MLVGFASAQASKYSADLSESVTRAKRRQAECGEHLGGPLPLGYVKGDTPAIDPAHAPTIERIMDLAHQGVPDSQIARTVNAEGFRTRKGRPFDRRAIQAIVTNVFYSGRIAYEDTIYDGQHSALVTPEVFDAIQAARPQRDLGKGHHQAGAPARRHLLARLAVCAECGERMYAVTSPYRRKDGTKARQYVCHAYKFGTGLCDAKPVNAEVVDTAVMESLHDVLPDFEAWIAAIEDRHADERARLAQLVEKAEAERDRQEANVGRHERRYRDAVASDDDTKADLLLEFVAQARRDVEDAETRLKATKDAFDSIPDKARSDRLLDFAIGLRDAIRGKVDRAHSVDQVNRALHEAFESFLIWRQTDDEPACLQPSYAAGCVAIEPILRPEITTGLFDWDAVEPAPPMAWIEAIRYSDHSHAYRGFSRRGGAAAHRGPGAAPLVGAGRPRRPPPPAGPLP
jgi:hypothetical protein